MTRTSAPEAQDLKPDEPDNATLRRMAEEALYAIVSGADDGRDFYRDYQTVLNALARL